MAVKIPEKQVYLDNASTTYPKPPQVVKAVTEAIANVSLTTGRGTTVCEINPDSIVSQTRINLARFFNADAPNRFIYTYSATDSINTVLFGMLHEGDHIIISPLEHHAVSRAVHHLRTTRGVNFSVMHADRNGCIIPERIQEVVKPHTCLAAVSHISNVGGTIQPMKAIGEELKRLDIPLLIDASQSAGCHHIDIKEMHIDALAAPGHKSLLGLPGSGILYLNERMNPDPFRVGGTGVKSEMYNLPQELPVYYESGTPNVLGIIALGAALEFINSVGVDNIEKAHHALAERLLSEMMKRKRVHIVGPTNAEVRAPVISFNISGFTPVELSKLLADKYHIANRGGLHCAPMAHEFFGSKEGGGTVRISPAYLSPKEDVDYFFDVLDEILAS
jgi:cysteine desulfurase/selenocysteine lyase